MSKQNVQIFKSNSLYILLMEMSRNKLDKSQNKLTWNEINVIVQYSVRDWK